MPICVDWCGASGCTGQAHVSPFAVTAIMDGARPWTGATNRVDYIFGLSTNAVLAAQVFAKTDEVCVRRAIGDLDLVRDYTETRYGAKSWSHPRRVVARIEATRKGLDVRYVVTNMTYGAAEWLYDSLSARAAQPENLIKRHKSQLASDRTSCRSPLANQMRLILHTAAYWLILTVRKAIPNHNRWPAASSPPSGCDC